MIKQLSLYLFVAITIFIACNDNNNNNAIPAKQYHIFCWPSKTPCDNRERGLEFSYDITQIAIGVPPSQTRVATLVCCRYVRELMDTLKSYNELIKLHYTQRLNNFDKRHNVGSFEVYGNYSSNWQTGKSYFNLGFRDNSHPFGFSMFIPMLDAFDSFYDEVMEKWEECCSGEGNRQ